MSEDPSQEYEAVGDPSEDIGDEDAQIAARWIAELQAARKGPYKRWLQRSKRAVRRYRDEDMDNDEAGIGRRNAQFNVLWSNVNTVAPSVYSRGPKPVAERRYLDRDTLARAGATILQRSLTYAIEDSGLHETMMQCRTDLFLVGMGSAWLRYQAQYDKAAPQHQEQPADGAPENDDDDKPEYSAEDGQPQAYGARDRVKHQKICVDYCHWSDELFSPARFWSEITWRAKRAYYTRKQLARTFPKLTKEQIASIPLKAQRGRKQNDVTDQVREVVGKAEVWQIWDFEDREIIWICEDWAVKPLKRIEDQLNLSCFTPAARPVRATTTNDSIWPIPDYAIWHDQAGELDSLTARIAALTRAIKVVGVFDGSQAEIARLLDEGMENKLIAVKNWAKLVQRGGLDGSMYLLPIRDMAETLMGLYNARAQVKNDLYEISGVSDVVRGASDPNETAAAQKMKGQFSAVRGSDRKNEFNRFVRDTLVIMAEVMLEHYTDDMLWEMSDFEQWAKDQDLRAYAPLMGHNGGPPLDDPAPPMAQMPPLQGAPAATPLAPGASASPAAPLLSVDQTPAQAPVPPMIQQQAAAMPPGSMGGPAPMASAPGTPPIPGLQMPPGAQPPMAQPPAPKPPTNPPGADRELFNRALELLRDDKLRSFRIQVETNSTIEPDATQDQQARVEFLGAVTTFLAQAREMAVAYPQMMPVMGKMLLFGARGFPVGRELESSLEGLIADLEQMAKNPAPKPPSPEEVKAQTAREQGAMKLDQMKLQAQQQQQAFQLELQKMQAEMQALREKLEIEREKMMMEMRAMQQKLDMERERGAMKLQQDAQAGAIKTQQMHEQAAIDSQGMERQAEHDERMLGRKEQHEETKMDLALEAAEQKAKAASVPSAGRKAPGNGKGAS